MKSSEQRLESGIKLQQGLDITLEFTEYYLNWLKENQSYATTTIKYVEDFLDTLAYDVDELFLIE